MTQWLTPAQTAQTLGCSYRTVMRLLQNDAIPVVYIGKRRKIHRDALDFWIQNGGSRPIDDASGGVVDLRNRRPEIWIKAPS